jgi:hypothetical protein
MFGNIILDRLLNIKVIDSLFLCFKKDLIVFFPVLICLGLKTLYLLYLSFNIGYLDILINRMSALL